MHLIRNSLEFASYEDRKAPARALRPVYATASAQAPNKLCSTFQRARWESGPMIVQCWRRAWEQVTLLFVFPPDIRRMVYTTNAIESLNMQLRNRGKAK